MKLPRQRYEKSHKWWHSIARGDKYYTNHCLSGMGISFAIWPWIRMVVVNKMFAWANENFYVVYKRSQYLDENAFHSLLKKFNENSLPNGNDKILISLFNPSQYVYSKTYLHKGQILSKLSWIFIGRRHFYPDSNREWEKGLYTVKEKSDCATRYILLIGMIAKPNSIQIYNKYMFWN